ncbi:hypothetical protein PNEG_01751 [Pneumocystis murina B123]|uniref:Uncharacterized protein n=1 Tax=Pneumocystis murina (strain B123) TaxID=1069680 RepID=M7NMT4_PNEMU|nr:hypothetical protein PNEG_01751 [Pneumocystis murina B123]EMR09993.1 hypothetical protein PNEG_01751 [Pneumocystis murina B123]
MMYKRQNISGLFFGMTLKLFILFTVYKLFFVCPLESPSKTKMLLCRNYHYLKSSMDPYLKSIYYKYALEQVEMVEPYLKNVQKNVGKYSKPAIKHIKDQYENYIYPYFVYGKESIYKFVKKHIGPVKIKYIKEYDRFYRNRFKDYLVYSKKVYWTHIYPGIYSTRQTVIYIYQSKLIPFYQQTKPHVIHFLKTMLQFLIREVYPRIVEGLIWLKDFFFTYAVPKFNDFWITHVNPQLERIYDRIFQYKNSDYNIASETQSSRYESPEENILDQKKNTHISYDQTENQLFSEILSLWTDRLNKIGKEIEEALIEDLVDVFLPVIYKKEKAVIQNLLNELNLLVNSEISKIKNKIIPKDNVLKGAKKDIFYNIDDIKEAGKTIHAKALEIRKYLKSIENDCKKKIIKKSKLYFNQVIIFQSEITSLFEVFIKLSTKDENYKKVYNKYFDFKNLIDTIEKQFFDSILNSTLSSVKQIRNLSIKAELAVNNITGLAAKQLKDFKSINASNNITQKLYDDPTDENNALSKLSEKSKDQSIVLDNSKQETEQENEKMESEHPVLNQDSDSYMEKQVNSNSNPSDNKDSMENINYDSSQTDPLHLQKETIRA